MGFIERMKDLLHGLFSPYYNENIDEADDIPRYRGKRLSDDSDAEDRRERRYGIVSIHTTTQVKVVLVKPTRFEDASGIADHILGRRTVVLNLEDVDKDVARRLIDFLSGAVYASEGAIKRVAPNTYLVSPYDIDITGDLLGELEDSGAFF